MPALLLDTHIFLWLNQQPDRLSKSVHARLERSSLCLSAASAHEIGIKYRLGKLKLPEPPATYVSSRVTADEIREIPITIAHAIAAADLPSFHADPFDRLIIAQALLEELVLVTADRLFEPYSAQILWAD